MLHYMVLGRHEYVDVYNRVGRIYGWCRYFVLAFA